MTYYNVNTSDLTRGIFISIEGIDGAGKSTAVTTISRILQQKDLRLLETKEPISPFRELILENDLTSKAQLYLFLASRAETVRNYINPNLESGVSVICDRYIDSTVAYQVYGNQIPQDQVYSLMAADSEHTPEPDLTIWLDIPVSEMRKRISKPDVIESKGDDFYQRVVTGYQDLAAKHSRIVRIDGTLSVDQVKKDIEAAVSRFIEGVR